MYEIVVSGNVMLVGSRFSKVLLSQSLPGMASQAKYWSSVSE